MEAVLRGSHRRAATTDPADDLLSELIAVSDGSDRLTQEEVISTAILLFAAGFETTTNLIGNGLWALLAPSRSARAACARRWPTRRRCNGRSRSCCGGTARSSSTAGRRCATSRSRARLISAGEQVMTLLGAANRDPRRFADPETLDLGRDEGPPMSFGSGIHYCLGAALARLEGQVCFGRLLTRFKAVELRDGRDRLPRLHHAAGPGPLCRWG